MSNADLFTICNIDGMESFLIKSQLRWAGHVLRMHDDRIPKILMYSQLDSGQRNVGRPLLRFKDKLKSNLSAANIDHATFESTALDRKTWRTLCYNGIKNFAASEVTKLRQARERTRALASVPAIHSNNPHSCSICGLLCKSLAGLKCHLRLTHKVK